MDASTTTKQQAKANFIEHLKKPVVKEAEAEAEEGDYEDEEVVVPWGTTVENESEAEEGVYSDEEFTLPNTLIQTEPDSVDDDIPAFRPVFPISPQQSKTGPLILSLEIPHVEVPASINRFLRVYQREGVEFLYRKYKEGTGGILGDDMG